MSHDIFISYSKGEKKSASALCHHLEQEGVRCWIAPRDVEPGADWTDSISEAIENSKALLVIFSDESAASRHVKSEVRSAFDHGKILVPVRVSDIQPTGGFDHLLGTSHWVDAFPKPLSKYFFTVSKTLQRLIDDKATIKLAKETLPHKKNFTKIQWATSLGIIVFIFFALAYLNIFRSKPISNKKEASIQTEKMELKTNIENESKPKDPPTWAAFNLAYVLSNWKYKNNPSMTLKGAQKDGFSVKNALKQLGYRVILKENLSKSDINSMLKDLRELETDGGTFIIYYAGQSISLKGETFIIPADLPPIDNKIDDFISYIVNVSDFLETSGKMESYILYSTRLGQYALDKAPGKENSPFAIAFIDSLDKLSDVLDFAMNVSSELLEITKNIQQTELIAGYVNSNYGLQTRSGKLNKRRFVFFDGCRANFLEKKKWEPTKINNKKSKKITNDNQSEWKTIISY